jgi:uncharacterized protein
MEIEFDEVKHRLILAERGLDMKDVARVFDGPHLNIEDVRKDYGEARFNTVGFLDGRMVMFAWTRRAEKLRVISLRKANAREQAAFGPSLRPGYIW